LFDHAHPYAGGQHRGVDLGAPSGGPVLAPAEGVVTFAGTVPTGGKTVSIQTPFGYIATLVHLGSIGVTRGALVGEASVVGTVGPSGVVELTEPYVYFGTRVTSDPQGYIDPLTLLPPRVAPIAPPAVEVPVSAAAAATAPSAPAEPSPAAVAQAAAEPTPSATTTQVPETTQAATASPVTEANPAATAAPAQTMAAAAAEHAPTDASTVGEAPVAASAAEATPAQPATVEPPVPPIAALHIAVIQAEAGAPLASVLADIPQLLLRSSGLGRLDRAPVESATPAMGRRHVDSVSPSRARDGDTALPLRRAEDASPLRLRGEPRTVTVARASANDGAVGSLRFPVVIAVLTVAAGLMFAYRRRSTGKVARIMVLPRPEQNHGRAEPAETEDLGGAGLAVRSREEASGPRGRLRSARGHLCAVPPAERQRRPDGERHGRARHAGNGHGGSRRRLAA
jgi:hypothetical protein